jgi:HipA-like protein
MASLDLFVFVHDRFVGTVEPDRRNRTRVTLDVDAAYVADLLLSESFTALPGRRPPVDAVSNFLGGSVPEGRHREVMAATRRVDKDDLFALLRECGGSLAGAVTLRPPDEPAPYRPRYDPLDDGALSARRRPALDDSDQAIGDDSRSTLRLSAHGARRALGRTVAVSPWSRSLDAHPQAPGPLEAQPTRRRALQPPADPAPRTLELRE